MENEAKMGDLDPTGRGVDPEIEKLDAEEVVEAEENEEINPDDNKGGINLDDSEEINLDDPNLPEDVRRFFIESKEADEREALEREVEEREEKLVIAKKAKAEELKIEIEGVRWYTKGQLSRVLRISPRTIQNYVNLGKIDAMQIDKTRFYRLSRYM